MSQLPEPSEFREPPEVMSPIEVMREFGLLSVEDERPSRPCIDCGQPAFNHRLCNRCFVLIKL